jgi:thiol:disulfide interchange protein DsbC
MNRFVRFAALVAAAIAFSSAHADLGKLRDTVQQHVGQKGRVTSVSATPYAGIYEVVINNSQIGYTDAKGQVFIAGNMFDFKTSANLSERRLEELRRVDFSKLPLDKAIVKVKGNGARKLAVFSDPDCPFCKRLEPELEKLENVTIYTFLYPLTGLHPDAMRKATLVWCSADRVQAWDDLMLRGKLPEGGNLSCATPILEIIDLAKTLGINGTPGIVFADGQMVPGMLPLEQIEARLARAVSAKPAS